MVDSNIRQHFCADESNFINQILDVIATASNQYRPVLTNFLNPRQLFIASTLVNRNENLKMKSWGGYSGAEMQRLLIYPEYYVPNKADFNIDFFEVNYPTKFAELHHRQILGTLMGSGLTRDSFGDIINDQTQWQFVANNNIQDYITQEVDRIGKVHVQMKIIEEDDLVHPQSDWEPMHTTVPSMRLDAVIANIFNYSRNRAKEDIEHGLVRVNWEEINRPDYQLAIQDLVSVRHGGRFRLLQTGGRNRKNNIRLDLQIITA